MRLASRVPGRGPQSPPLAPHTRDASRSLPPTPTPLVFEASENTMTRPPENRRHRSRPRTRTPSRAATAKQHPERKASRGPSHRRALSGERDRENRHARDRQCQGLNYSRGPRQRRVSRPTSTGPPLSSSPTHRTHHTRTHTHSLSPHPTAARLSTTTPTGTRRSSGTQNHSFKSIPTLSQMWPEPRGWAAIYVQDIDAPCVLRFAWIHALCCALHRSTSRVIHRPRS